MRSTLLVLGALFGVGLLLAFILVATGISANNTEVRLRNEFTAQKEVNTSSFDKMWKTLQQQTGVAEHERDSFRETYTQIMTATQGVAGNGQLASFFTQAKVDVSPALFQQLMVSIEAQRESFHRDQMKLANIKRQHDDIRGTFPYSLVVGGRPALELQLVTSSRTQEAFRTGTDENVDLFQKK